jgi:hypothetical protein
MKTETSNPLPLRAEFGSRLVTLCDGRIGLRGGLPVETRSLEGSAPVLEFIASNEALDRCDEIIMADGWRLENYRRNPVFQNAHQYGDVLFTLGKALITEVRTVNGRRALFQRVEFAVEANPVAQVAYKLYQGGFLRAVSVGFIPLRWEEPSARGGSGGEAQRLRRRYLDQELLEVSAVGIPANPEALALGLKTGALRRADAWALCEFLLERLQRAPKHAPAHPEEPSLSGSGREKTSPGIPGPGEEETGLLRLARELRRQMR